MTSEFIPYELALRMKQLGFGEPCFGLYSPPSKTVFLHHYGLLTAKEQVLAPLYQQAFRWFIETYRYTCRVHVGVRGFYYRIDSFIDSSNQTILFEVDNLTNYNPIFFDTYEKAELACLNELIEIAKK